MLLTHACLPVTGAISRPSPLWLRNSPRTGILNPSPYLPPCLSPLPPPTSPTLRLMDPLKWIRSLTGGQLSPILSDGRYPNLPQTITRGQQLWRLACLARNHTHLAWPTWRAG